MVLEYTKEDRLNILFGMIPADGDRAFIKECLFNEDLEVRRAANIVIPYYFVETEERVELYLEMVEKGVDLGEA